MIQEHMLTKLRSILKKISQFSKLAPDYFLLRFSRLFDKKWYLENNPDIFHSKIDPVWHYLAQGGFEGRDPSSGFCSGWYLNHYEDVKQAGINPLIHYLKYGKKEGREPLTRELTQLLEEEADLALIRSSGWFDGEMYLINNPDVAQANLDPLLHYFRYGGFEGRDLEPHFYSQWYLDTYDDVKKSGINPLVHYLKYGKSEDRRATPTSFTLMRMYDYSKQIDSIAFEDSPERIYLQRPKVIGNFSGRLDEGEAECPRPYVSVITDAIIVGGENLVMARDETILSDELVDFMGKEFGKNQTV